MSNLPVDRKYNNMHELWGATDYNLEKRKRVIQEIMHDSAPRHDLKKQTDLHEKIRNDDDYDDWEYGTEPNYGSSWH
jgi:hypothetical protein